MYIERDMYFLAWRPSEHMWTKARTLPFIHSFVLQCTFGWVLGNWWPYHVYIVKAKMEFPYDKFFKTNGILLWCEEEYSSFATLIFLETHPLMWHVTQPLISPALLDRIKTHLVYYNFKQKKYVLKMNQGNFLN